MLQNNINVSGFSSQLEVSSIDIPTAMVLHFLYTLKMGSIIFPTDLPVYQGWDASSFLGNLKIRLKWSVADDRARIIHGVTLLFEHLRSYPWKQFDPVSTLVIRLRELC